MKGGILKRQGGTITPFGFRSGDYVQTTYKGEIVRGWVGGFIATLQKLKMSQFMTTTGTVLDSSIPNNRSEPR